MIAFLFPGQGSQVVGMGKALAEHSAAARRTFEEADEALGCALSKVCFEGPEAELKRTETTQPALLATGVAILAALREARSDLEPSFVAGHSLGEWTALVAAGAISFADALRAVRERGRLMQLAVPEGKGAMFAILGGDAELITEVCREVEAELGKVVRPANFNAPEQTVISGDADATKVAADRIVGQGAKKAVALAVSAPFHSPLMRPAAEGLAVFLEKVAVKAPKIPVITNVEATPNADPTRVKALLIEQITAPVRWVECMGALRAAGVTRAYELGPSKVLAGLQKRIDRSLSIAAIEDPQSLAAAIR
ncbi:MAG: ACP S-malonyltransferase [Deltaproteobacteria bacterium]|nr:ACP S-malonyltransferase [Deltaproteobacteria bacterium]